MEHIVNHAPFFRNCNLHASPMHRSDDGDSLWADSVDRPKRGFHWGPAYGGFLSVLSVLCCIRSLSTSKSNLIGGINTSPNNLLFLERGLDVVDKPYCNYCNS